MMGNFLAEILRIFGATYPLMDRALVMQAGLVAGLPLLGRALVMQACQAEGAVPHNTLVMLGKALVQHNMVMLGKALVQTTLL
jgi:hypothetical protein